MFISNVRERRPRRRLNVRGLHRDERSISIVSVFAVMFLAMLLGMVMNVGRHVDGKLRMQNAADSAAYSGGVVLARGMNTLTFTNHLLCDVFAVHGLAPRGPRPELRLLRLRRSWPRGTRWPRSSPLRLSQVHRPGPGHPAEDAAGAEPGRRLFGIWAKAVSDQVLPLMERDPLRRVDSAVSAGGGGGVSRHRRSRPPRETAARNGQPDFGRGHDVRRPVAGRRPAGGRRQRTSYSADDRTLPVVDPELDSVPNLDQYVQTGASSDGSCSPTSTSTTGTTRC